MVVGEWNPAHAKGQTNHSLRPPSRCSKLIRATKLEYEDGRDEVVFVPLLYALTWEIGNEYDWTDDPMTLAAVAFIRS